MGHDQYTHATSPSVDMAISYNWRTCKVHLLVNIFAWPCKSMSNHCRTRYSDDLFRISISNSRWTQWRYLHEKIFLAIGNDNVPLFNQCNCKYHCNQRTLDSAIHRSVSGLFPIFQSETMSVRDSRISGVSCC